MLETFLYIGICFFAQTSGHVKIVTYPADRLQIVSLFLAVRQENRDREIAERAWLVSKRGAGWVSRQKKSAATAWEAERNQSAEKKSQSGGVSGGGRAAPERSSSESGILDKARDLLRKSDESKQPTTYGAV